MRIGITGTVSAGKTTVLKFLKAKKYSIFSADEEVGKLYKNKSFLKLFSAKIGLKYNKNLKESIKELIIKKRINLKTLEKHIHPKVRGKMLNFLKKKRRKKLIFLEIPLLSERNLFRYFDETIFIGASKKIRLKRFIKKGGNKSLFQVLEKRQHSSKQKVRRCDRVINNNKSIKVLKKNLINILSNYE